MIAIYAVAITAAFTLFALALAIYLTRSDSRTRLAELRRRLGAPDADAGSLLRSEQGSKLDRLLDESGLGWQPAQFINWVISAGAVGALAGGILGGPGLAFLFALIGLALFPMYAVMARHARQMKCEQQFPQALQLMVLALRAGHALPGALALAAREAPLPIRDELRYATDQHSLGRPIGQVLENLAIRLPRCEAAQTFSVAVLVLEQTGGNLINVLDRIIESARARTQYKARLRALTAQGRMSAWILGCMPIAFACIAALLDPTYAATLPTGSGVIIIVIVLALWLCGITWTVSMVRKESQR